MNSFLVGVTPAVTGTLQSGLTEAPRRVVIQRLSAVVPGLERDDALRLAAWLVVAAESLPGKPFPIIRAEEAAAPAARIEDLPEPDELREQFRIANAGDLDIPSLQVARIKDLVAHEQKEIARGKRIARRAASGVLVFLSTILAILLYVKSSSSAAGGWQFVACLMTLAWMLKPGKINA